MLFSGRALVQLLNPFSGHHTKKLPSHLPPDLFFLHLTVLLTLLIQLLIWKLSLMVHFKYKNLILRISFILKWIISLVHFTVWCKDLIGTAEDLEIRITHQMRPWPPGSGWWFFPLTPLGWDTLKFFIQLWGPSTRKMWTSWSGSRGGSQK